MSTFETADVHHGVFLYSIGAPFLGLRVCHGHLYFLFERAGVESWNAAYEQGRATFSRQQLTHWSPLFCERVCEHLGFIVLNTPEEGGEEA